TGNMLRAFNILTSFADKVHFEMVNFSRDNGNKEFGLVIARQDEDRLIGFTEGSMMRDVDWHEAHTYLTDPMVETERIATSRDGVITIESVILERKDKKDATSTAKLEFAVSIRGRQDKGGKYYQDKGLLAYVRNNNFRKSGAQMIGNVSLDNLEGLMKELANKFGLRFTLPLDSMAPMPYKSTPKSAEQVAAFMPFVSALTDKFMSNPFKEVPPIYIKDVLDPILKSQNDFQFKDKYLGLPWWNAKKYPAWRRAFEIFGIHRPENRGRLMHNFAQIAEPYFKLEENMKKAGRTSAEIAASRDRINRVITTGDALLGPQLRSLRMQVRTMPKGPERDRLMERIAQIERDNRYSDEQLLAGIKDDQGNKIQLNLDEIRVYSAVRKSLDTMFDSYVDHLQAMAFRNWEKQKWYAILCQAAGMDLSKDSTMRLVGSGLNRAAILRAVKIQPDIQKIFERVEAKIAQTPEIEKKKAGEVYGLLADRIADQIRGMEKALSEITGETDPAKLTQMTKEIFNAYLFTRPHLKKVKALRNLYKKQVAFFPRVREQGEWKMRAVRQTKDNTGNVVAEEQLFMKMFDSRNDAAKIYKEIMDRYAVKGELPPDIVIQPPEKAVKTPEFAFQGVNDINMQKVLDDAIEGLKIRETYFDENGNKVNLHDHLRNLGYLALAKQFQSRGFGRHMIHRQTGVVKGYEEIDLQRTLFNYMTGMSGIMTKQIAAADFLEHMKTVSESNDNKMFTALAKYGKDQLRNETAADRFSNKVRSFMFTWYLGGVIRPALVQFTQNFVTGIPKHGQWLRENNLGGAGRADKDYSTAMKDVATKNYTPLEAMMQAQLFTDGVTVDQYIREIFGALGSKWQQGWNKGLQMLAVPFSKMEIFNRQSAALTRFRPAYELALKKVGKDKFTEEDAYNEAFNSARDFVYDTHYAMGKANLPQVAQGEGIGTAIKTLYTFKSFTHNFALATLQDNDWKATLHSMAYIALFGGLMALPFWKDFFEYIEKHYGYSPVNSLRKTLRGLGGRTLETFGMGGLPALLGANISGSLAIGVPFVGEEMLSTVGGVYEGQATKVMRAVDAAGRKDWYRVASNLAPEVMRGPIVAAQESKVGKEALGTPGYATTTKGRPVFNKEGKPLSLGPGEAAVKAAGFQPTEFAREREMDQTIKRQEAWAADAKASAAETYRVARINKDPDALKNMMKAVKEINQGIKDRGIQAIVPLTSVAKIVQSSRQIKGKGELREEAYKRSGL
ncbi:MAG: PLxRFG domain-containing protein, partial [Methanothrix sp.]|nr:PLxRFG domain-containing protein [Methanothrix sp.]